MYLLWITLLDLLRVSDILFNELGHLDLNFNYKTMNKYKGIEESLEGALDQVAEVDRVSSKTDLTEVFDLLISKAKQEDKAMLELSLEVVDNINSPQKDIDLAVGVVRDKGYKDFAHFLEYLAEGYTKIAISENYKLKLGLK